jgi:hypothetical protein
MESEEEEATEEGVPEAVLSWLHGLDPKRHGRGEGSVDAGTLLPRCATMKWKLLMAKQTNRVAWGLWVVLERLWCYACRGGVRKHQ